MKKYLFFTILALFAFCFMVISCNSVDNIESGMNTDVLGDLPKLMESSTTELLSKEDIPIWLAEKTSEIEKTVPPMAIYKVYQCNWRSKTIFFIYNNFSSCLLCDTYYDDGKKVEWQKTADSEDFINNSTRWKCIYVISNTPTNTLLILSNNDRQGSGLVARPHCFTGKENRLEGDSLRVIHQMIFACDIKESTVFDGLEIIFEGSQPFSFNKFKTGDTFDISQFKVRAEYHRTWTEKIIKMALSLSGEIKIIDIKTEDGKSYISLSLQDIKFDAIDKSCIYAIDGTIDYEIGFNVASMPRHQGTGF